MDLISVVNKNALECLNQNSKQPIENALFQSNRDLFLESDSDPEILIKIAFQQPVDLTGISIGCRKSDIEDNCSPKEIKLFANDPDIGFQDAEIASETQSLTVTKEQAENGSELTLRLAKFRRITHLSIFIQSNYGNEDKTRISNLCLIGQCPEVMNMKDWKPTKEQE